MVFHSQLEVRQCHCKTHLSSITTCKRTADIWQLTADISSDNIYQTERGTTEKALQRHEVLTNNEGCDHDLHRRQWISVAQCVSVVNGRE